MDKGTGTLSVCAFLHINRAGGVTPSFNDSFLQIEGEKIIKKGDLPYCLGKTQQRNRTRDYTYSLSTFIEEIITKKSSIQNIYNLSSIEYLKQIKWNEQQQFICFHPAFKGKNNEYIPIKLGINGSIKELLQKKETIPKRLAKNIAGGDFIVPLQHGNIIIGELLYSNTTYLLMNINSSENLMIYIFHPYLKTTTGLKTTSSKVRMGYSQTKMLLFDEFISCLYPRYMVEGFMSLKLKNRDRVKLNSKGLNSSAISTPMDELLAAVSEREIESDEMEELDQKNEQNQTQSQYTLGTHSPLLKEPKFIDVKTQYNLFNEKSSNLQEEFEQPKSKIQKISYYHEISDSQHIEELEIENPPGRDNKSLKIFHIDQNIIPENKIPKNWIFPSQSINQYPNLTNIFIRGINLCEIPKEIQNLQNLKFLTLSKNKIRVIPTLNDSTSDSSTCVFPNSLEFLDLSENLLEFFPLCNLPHLKYLNLQSNKLSHIDDSAFVYLVDLAYLNLSFNNLSLIPSSLKNCTKICSLLLSTNLFSNFPQNFFNFFSYLRRLDLSRFVFVFFLLQ